MRHASTWLWGLAQYGAAVFLVWQALGGSGRLLQAMAIVVLFLWAGLEAFRALARLLEAFSGHSCGDCGGDDGGGRRSTRQSPSTTNPSGRNGGIRWKC